MRVVSHLVKSNVTVATFDKQLVGHESMARSALNLAWWDDIRNKYTLPLALNKYTIHSSKVMKLKLKVFKWQAKWAVGEMLAVVKVHAPPPAF